MRDLIVSLFEVIGAALIVAGVAVLAGLGAALMVAGAFVLFGAWVQAK